MQLERRVRIETGEKLHQHLERGKGVVRVGKFEYAVSGHVHTNWLGCRNFFTVLMFRDLPPLCFTDNFLLLYLVIPIGTAVLMSKKTFDGKKPYSFLKSAVSFLLRPKQTYAGKRVKYRKVRTDEFITAVRREYYGVSGEIH